MLQTLGEEQFDAVLDMLLVPWLFNAFVNNLPQRLLLILWEHLLLPSPYHEGSTAAGARGVVVLVAFALTALRKYGEEQLEQCDTHTAAFKFVSSSVLGIPASEEADFLQAVGATAVRLGERTLSGTISVAKEIAEEKQRLADPLSASQLTRFEADRQQSLVQLSQSTHFSADELIELNKQFRSRWGDTGCDKETFRSCVSQVSQSFPVALCCDALFSHLDRFRCGQLSFAELMVGVGVLSRGGLDDKLHMAFNLFDSLSIGYLGPSDIVRLCDVLFRLSLRPGDSAKLTCDQDTLDDLFERETPRRPAAASSDKYARSMPLKSELRSRIKKSKSESATSRVEKSTSSPSCTEGDGVRHTHGQSQCASPTPSISPTSSSDGLVGRSFEEPFRRASKEKAKKQFYLSQSLLLKLLLAAEASPIEGARRVSSERFRHVVLSEPGLLRLFAWTGLNSNDASSSEANSGAASLPLTLFAEQPSRSQRLCKVCQNCVLL